MTDIDRFIIQGGRPLKGAVVASGAKNAALPLMAATILSEETSVLRRVPDIEDVHTMLELLEGIGAKVRWLGPGEVEITPGSSLDTTAPDHLIRRMRASILIMGPLLARNGKVEVTRPGGCAIGPRPINLHLDGLRFLGASIQDEGGRLLGTADRLEGTMIVLDFPSVGATQNLMMSATMAKGVTIIRNAAKEPEIADLQSLLNKMGAKVRGAGTDTIRIRGVPRLHGAEHELLPDRIEVGTFLVAGALTQGDVTIDKVIPGHLESVLAKLEAVGATIEDKGDALRVRMTRRPEPLAFRSLPYPGFPTDLQPQMSVIACVANGVSVIYENVFSSRFKHLDELIRMGALVFHEERYAVITGADALQGAYVSASDLRGGAALVLAGLVAKGQTEVENAHHVHRGYEDFTGKLLQLGAEIGRLS